MLKHEWPKKQKGFICMKPHWFSSVLACVSCKVAHFNNENQVVSKVLTAFAKVLTDR